jgi:hypothetical protein
MNKTVDILSFNAVKESEQGYDLAMKTTDGQDTGVIFTIIGKYSDPVQKWTKRIFTEYQREVEIARRKNREPAPKSLDEMREQNVEGAMVRVIGFKNVKQEFSKEVLKEVLLNNPHWIDAIIDESDNAANFTKAL